MWRRGSAPSWRGKAPPPHQTSEPGALAVFAIGVAEFRFQNRGLAACPHDLHGSNRQQNNEQVKSPKDENQPGQKDFSRNVNRIADARVDAASDQLGRFRNDGEGSAQRVAGENHAREADQTEQQTDPSAPPRAAPERTET